MLYVPLATLRKYAPYLFAAAVIATLMVWIPDIGVVHNGARRWLNIAGFSLQPAEFLKVGVVLFYGSWLATHHKRIADKRYGLYPYLACMGVVAATLLIQPDTGTLLVIGAAVTAMYLAAGARFRDLAIVGGIAVAALSVLVALRPYVMRRIITFLDPTADPLGAGYQLNQSLIAVGSGEWWGRGYGQSIQKFNFLPEPISDSIFSVASEEFGFLGGSVLIMLFVALAYHGIRIATTSVDLYGGLVALGLVILIVFQSFMNIASMIGVMPLTGLPLVFISNGGTAMIISLLSVGIILQVSKQTRTTRTPKRASKPEPELQHTS
jgi:cell division protein FtsW